jgi:dephospho-CoA kinase
MVLGVTGPFSSGKSKAALFFRRRGFGIIDVDSIGHSVLGRPAVRSSLRKAFGRQAFGSKILFPSGRVDRGLLGNLVFGNPRKLARLNRIAHPLMRKEVRLQAKRRRSDCVIDAALLFEMKLDKLCDKIILVTAPVKEIMKRGKKRNGFDAAKIRSILASQRSVAVKRKKADFVVNNGSSLKSFNEQMARIFGILASNRKV